MKKITKPNKPPYSDLTHAPTQNISNAASTTTIDVQQLQNGIYLLALYADGIALAQSKIAVQH
jgi:hypothetical protein